MSARRRFRTLPKPSSNASHDNRQCAGTTKDGRRCSITTKSTMTNVFGKLVCEPLRRGGTHCLFHIVLFHTVPCRADNGVLVFLDLETTGLSLYDDQIVEIGVIAESGEVFATVVKPHTISNSSAAAVHGIDPAELKMGPLFSESFERLCQFLDNVLYNANQRDSGCSGLLITAHNGLNFDFPMMLSECYRHKCPIDIFHKFLFVDTLHVARALDPQIHGGCIKLQCLLHQTSCADRLRAHRALDSWWCKILRLIKY